ncbi:hypothetical protein CVT24_011764 [Panaeolus cyanescens]|uniref:Major facilitator superfamily (MFS) profile domain-containing protein n=1 Tax=Panaeolus cyanescens TaxID=181874 RepID=A0A409VHL7_9AGAR|nr:hypothetical protein CVT24_011764 [Panaeolus cyanescens]
MSHILSKERIESDYASTTEPPSEARIEPPPLQLTDQTNLLPFRKIVPCFFGLALCIVVSTLDSVVVATSLPTISVAFNAGSFVSWVPSAYLLTSTSFQPLYGRFSDIFGRKVAISIAMCFFMLGNLLAGFSKTIIQLIVFRGIAGVGGGGIVSMAQIVISDIVSLRERYSRRDRGKYQGIVGGVIALGYAIGPVIGGALSQKASWRWSFWISVPTSLSALLVVIFLLPLKPVSGDMISKLLAIDYVGMVLTLLGCILVILPIIWGGVTFPWSSPIVLGTLFSGVVIVIAFCLWEWKKARLPIVPMYIFKHSTVTGVYITMFVNGFVYFSTSYYLPQFFQAVLSATPIGAGVFLIPVLVSQMIVSWISGMIVSKTGKYRYIIHSGFTLWSVACGLISTINPDSHKSVIAVYMILAGCGAGQTLQTTTVAAQASVSRKDMSVVTAFRNFVRLLGGTLALAVGGTVVNNFLRNSMAALALDPAAITKIVNDPSLLSSPSTYTELGLTEALVQTIRREGYTKGFRAVFIMNAVLTAIATIASITLIKHKELTRGDEDMLKQKAKEEAGMTVATGPALSAGSNTNA